MRFALWFVVGMLVFGIDVAAQEHAPDSLPAYELQEIVVRDEQRVEAQVFTLQRVTAATLEQSTASSASQLARLLPSAHVPTNSRGESLLYFRGAGERQTAIFLDGALLNVPWDNRLDLALIPAGLIGGITIAKGAPAIEYGANVLGGAVNLTTPRLEYGSRLTEIGAAYGSAQTREVELTHRGRVGGFSYAAGAGHVQRDGLPLPADADLPYNQSSTRLRTNSDRRIGHAFARGAYAFSPHGQMGITLVHIDADQGVAPESHIPMEEARLWRYPDWQYTLGIVSGEGALGVGTRWKASGWVGNFHQTIDAYDSLEYTSAVAREDHHDVTAGARFTLAQDLGPGTMRLSANGLISTHRQRDRELDPEEHLGGAVLSQRLIYRQQLAGLGAAYEMPVLDGLYVAASVSIDVMRMPITGDKPERDPFTDYSYSLGARYALADGIFARGVIGRKTRFPTMRELFGEALNRFLLNPDLKPESALLAEVAVGVEQDRIRIEVIPFLNRTTGTLDQRFVDVEDGRKRQRINLAGSSLVGIELTADARLFRHVQAVSSLTLMDIRRTQDAPEDPTHLAEKPGALGVAMVRYAGPQGLSASVESVYMGRAYSLDSTNELVPLPRSVELNARIGYRLDGLVQRVSAELFARVDNLTDALVVPQLGLPGPGRMFRIGLKLSF